MLVKHGEIGRRVHHHPAAFACREVIPAFDQKEATLMTEVIRLPITAKDGNRAGIWPTETAQGLAEIIENCRLNGQLGLITGPSGIGKTTAARAAVKAADRAQLDGWNSPTVAFVSMTRATEGLQPGLLRIAAAARVSVSAHLGANDVHESIVARDWGEGSLLVLDEAQFMTDALLHGVRNIWDELAERGRPIGIVLVGTSDLADRLKSRGRKASAFEAFRGRLGASMEIGALEAEDCSAICQFHGITEQPGVALIRRAAAMPGGLHNVARLLDQAKRAVGNGKAIAFADLKRAAALSGVAS